MKKTGERLRTQREHLNLSISEAALVTKINPKILTAIEAGEGENLPAETFLKGFIRSYAVFLKIDAEEIMRIFYEETAPPPPPVEDIESEVIVAPPVQHVAPVAKAEPEVVSTKDASRDAVNGEGSNSFRYIAAFVIVVLIGLIVGIRNLIEKYQKEQVVEAPVNVKPLPEVEPDLPSQQVAPVVPDKIVEKERPKAPSEESEPIPPAEPVKEEVAASTQGPPAPTPEPVKVAEKEKPSEEASPAVSETTMAAKYEIILEALDKVDVKIQINDQTKRIALAPMQVHTLRTSDQVRIDVSDGGAVNIIVNGRDRGVPGDLGKPKQIRIP